jgi:hypothetical protein
VKVYAGIDPLTGREIRLRRTCKTERAARIELGKLLAMAQAGRQPDSAVTVAQLLNTLPARRLRVIAATRLVAGGRHGPTIVAMPAGRRSRRPPAGQQGPSRRSWS